MVFIKRKYRQAFNRRGKWVLLGGLVVLAGGLVYYQNTHKNTDDQAINWYLPTNILTLDPSKVTDSYSSIAIGNSSGTLLRVDQDGELKPDLAKSVEVSPDGKTYTATLRDNLKWSDGSPLTAQDIVYTWQRLVDPKTASEYANLPVDGHVLNAQDIVQGKKPVSDLGVKAQGNKVIFSLSSPAPQFKNLLSFANFVPQKKAFVQKAGSDYGTNSKEQIYSGAYKVEAWNGTSGTFKLVKNKYYWDAKNVKTKVINIQTVAKPDTALQMYKQGDLDVATISNTQAMYDANKRRKDIVKIPEATTTYVVYNATGSVPGLNNTKVRQAINLATNRAGVVKAAIDTGSKPAVSLVPQGMEKLPDGQDLSDFVAPGYSYDPKKAAQLFKEGLAESGQKSLKLSLTADADNPVAKLAVDYLKETWEKVLPNLKIEERFVPFKQRLADTSKQNFDIALVLWGGDYPEGSTFYSLFTSDSPYNYGKTTSPIYDAAYQSALTTHATDPQAGAQDYKEAEKAAYDNAFYNPIYFRYYRAVQNPRLKGLVRNATGLQVDFTHAYKK